jgi:hypothetical protein
MSTDNIRMTNLLKTLKLLENGDERHVKYFNWKNVKGRPRYRRKDNTEDDPRETGKCVDLNQILQDTRRIQ